MNRDLTKFHNSIINGSVDESLMLLKPNSRIRPEKQMEIYTEGYRARLTSAVKADYPAFINYMGKKAFSLISEFVSNTNSSFYSLDFYPIGFATFLDYEDVKHSVKELAALESRIIELFYAPESKALDPESLLNLTEKQFDQFRFKPRAAYALIGFDNDVEKYLSDFRQGKKPRKVKSGNIFLYLVRHNNEIKRHRLMPEEFILLKNLINYSSIEQAVENAKINSDSARLINDNLPIWIKKWLEEGFFAA